VRTSQVEAGVQERNAPAHGVGFQNTLLISDGEPSSASTSPPLPSYGAGSSAAALPLPLVGLHGVAARLLLLLLAAHALPLQPLEAVLLLLLVVGRRRTHLAHAHVHLADVHAADGARTHRAGSAASHWVEALVAWLRTAKGAGSARRRATDLRVHWRTLRLHGRRGAVVGAAAHEQVERVGRCHGSRLVAPRRCTEGEVGQLVRSHSVYAASGGRLQGNAPLAWAWAGPTSLAI
jgi:hypothetical protein